MSAFEIDAPPVAYWNSNPYAVSFSPDGSQLAVGSGGWYGNGGISLVDVARGEEDLVWRFIGYDEWATGMPLAPFDTGSRRVLAVSGVAFDGAGRFLAASTWSPKHGPGPILLFEVLPHGLKHHRTFELPDHHGLGGAATGLAFADGHLHVRIYMARGIEQSFQSIQMPSSVDSNVDHRHWSHARLAVVDNELITGGTARINLGSESGSSWFSGLVAGPPPRAVPASPSPITAVLALPGGGLLTGSRDGEILRWERGEDWTVQSVLQEGVADARGRYQQGVVALCALDDGRFFSATAEGEVTEWRDARPAITHALPRFGTPGALRSTPIRLGVQCLPSARSQQRHSRCRSLSVAVS